MASADPIVQEVVRRLIAFREQLHLTQEGLAHRSGVSRTTIANIESQRQGIPIPMLYKLGKGLGVDPTELLPSPEEVRDESVREVSVGGVMRVLPSKTAEAMSSVLDRPVTGRKA
jgi:transcriptional regulator with XRE-family HTH domain